MARPVLALLEADGFLSRNNAIGRGAGLGPGKAGLLALEPRTLGRREATARGALIDALILSVLAIVEALLDTCGRRCRCKRLRHRGE